MDATILGDDLYSRQPVCEAILNAGLNFILVCKPKSHKTLYKRVDGFGNGVKQLEITYNKEKHIHTAIDLQTNSLYAMVMMLWM